MAMIRSREQALLQLKVDGFRRTHIAYPKTIHIETLAICNAACSFCDYPQLARKGQRMDWALIEKIINDLSDIPADVPLSIFPFKINEPFLDKRIFDIIALIEKKLPQAKIKIHSNGSPLTESALLQLEKVKSLHRFDISLNYHQPEEYERVMGIPWDKTVARLDGLHSLLQKGHSYSCPVIITRVSGGDALDDDFRRFVGLRWPLFKVQVNGIGETLGMDSTKSTSVPAVGCTHWFEVSIAATGEVGLCCLDMHVEEPIGDVRSQHVLDVYNSVDFRQIREKAITRLDAPDPCKSCDYI